MYNNFGIDIISSKRAKRAKRAKYMYGILGKYLKNT